MVKALVTGGWLNLKVGGRPGQGLPGGGGPVDPGWGVDEGEPPEVGIPGFPTPPIEIPEPPPGIWPPPTPSHPIQPVPPENGNGGESGGPPPTNKPIDPDARPEHPIWTPGTIWPPPNAVGKFIVLAWIPGQGWKYIVIDASLKPTHPIAPGGEEPHPEPR